MKYQADSILVTAYAWYALEIIRLSVCLVGRDRTCWIQYNSANSEQAYSSFVKLTFSSSWALSARYRDKRVSPLIAVWGASAKISHISVAIALGWTTRTFCEMSSVNPTLRIAFLSNTRESPCCRWIYKVKNKRPISNKRIVKASNCLITYSYYCS